MCGGRAPVGTRNLSRPLCVSVYVVAAERTQHNALRYVFAGSFLFGFRAAAFWVFRQISVLLENPLEIERRARADTQTHTGALPVASLTVVRSAVRESRPCGWRSFHVCTRVSVCMGHDTGDVRETTNKLRPPPRPTSRRLVPILRSLLSPPRARAGDVSRPGVSAQPSLKPTTWARSARR